MEAQVYQQCTLIFITVMFRNITEKWFDIGRNEMIKMKNQKYFCCVVVILSSFYSQLSTTSSQQSGSFFDEDTGIKIDPLIVIHESV